MRRTKKLFLISIGCAGVVMALLLTTAMSLHLLANRDMVRTFIVAKTAQVTGGELKYGRLDLSFFPVPHLAARNVRLIQAEAFEVQAGELSIYPNILSILSGRLSIHRLILDKPDIRMHVAPPPDKGGPTPEVDRKTTPLSATVNKHIGDIFGALAAIDPETQIEVEHGGATLILPDGPDIRITAIQAIAENTNNVLSFNLSCSSNLFGKLNIDATADIDDRRTGGKIFLTDFNLRPFLPHLSLPGDLTTDDTQALVSLDFSAGTDGRAQGRFDFQAPSLTIRRKGLLLALAGVSCSGTIDFENDKLTFTIDSLGVQQPELDLSASAILKQDEKTGSTHLRFSASAEALNIALAGDVTQAIAGDLESIRTAFNLAKAGNLTQPSYIIDLEHDNTGWHSNKMKATGHLTRGRVTIPGIDANLEDMAGDVIYEDNQVTFNTVSGRFKGVKFKGLDATIDWEKQARLSIASSWVRIDAAPFFTWLTGFEGLSRVKSDIESMTGRAAVSKLEINGPLTEPEKWDFNIAGSPENLRMKSPRVPFPIKLSGGEIAYRPGNERSAGVNVEFLDGRFVSSHQSTGIVNPETVTWRIDGSMGPEALAWLSTIFPIPDHLQIKPPVELSGVDIVWNHASAFSFAGGLRTAGGVDLYTDVTYAPDLWQVRKIQFSDGRSKATVSASKRASQVELTFSGNVEKQTADLLLENNQTLSGRLEGDFQVRIDTENPLNALFTGRLIGSGLHIYNLASVPIEVNTFSVNGHGNRLEIGPTEVNLCSSRLSITGTVDHQGKDLTIAIDVNADSVDEELIRVFQPAGSQDKAAENKRTPVAVTPRGNIHLQADELTFRGFTWSPVKADILVAADSTHVVVNQADLCGISTTGELGFSPKGVSLYITPTGSGISLQETVNCLWHRKVSANAHYDLSGAIYLPPTRENPSQSLSGQMAFSSDNGRIKYANVLMKIFSVLNITEVFTGGKSDLTEDGYGYSKAFTKATIGNGKLHLEEILMDGNTLKLTGQGSIDLTDETADILLLAAPLKTVDRFVNKLPIIGYIAGGSLISIPLRVHGKLSDLSVVPMPPSAVGKGLIGIMERTLKAPFKLVEYAANHSSEQSTGEDTPPDDNRYHGP